MNKMKKKKLDLKRRHWRVRRKIKGSKDRPRLSVFRSNKNIYGQIIDDEAGDTLVSVSSMCSELKTGLGYGGNAKAAVAVGELLAQKAISKNISVVVFDRGGRKYHGRVKALADAARKGGLKF